MMEQPIVNQGSSFLQVRESNPLTEKERTIILAMVSMVHPSDEDEKDYERPAQEWYELLDIQGADSELQLKDIFQELLMKIVEIPQEDGGWLMTHWLSSVHYLQDAETVQIQLVPELKPYFLLLQSSLELD